MIFDGPGEDEDFGFEQTERDPSVRYTFRTAPLRNLKVAPAFFHNGAFGTLEAAIAHHLDVKASLRNYDPDANDLPPTCSPARSRGFSRLASIRCCKRRSGLQARVPGPSRIRERWTVRQTRPAFLQAPPSIGAEWNAAAAVRGVRVTRPNMSLAGRVHHGDPAANGHRRATASRGSAMCAP